MATKRQNKAEKIHVNKVAELGCVACYKQSGMWGTPGDIHHIRAGCGMAQRSNWYRVLCLCTGHHQYSTSEKIAFHASPEEFKANYGTEEELLALTLENL